MTFHLRVTPKINGGSTTVVEKFIINTPPDINVPSRTKSLLWWSSSKTTSLMLSVGVSTSPGGVVKASHVSHVELLRNIGRYLRIDSSSSRNGFD